MKNSHYLQSRGESSEGGEDFPSLEVRTREALAEIQDRHPDKNILMVTHGDTGKVLRAVYHGWTWEDGLKKPYFENTGVLELREVEDVLE